MKKNWQYYILIFFVLLISTTLCHATTYFVDSNRPDDSGSGLSWSSAKKTIMAGINLISVAGDTLLIKSGTYSGANNYIDIDTGDPNGTNGNEIIIRSDDGAGNYGTVIVQGTVDAPYDFSGGGDQVALSFYRRDYYKFEYIQFDAPASNAQSAAQFRGQNSGTYNTGITITGCTFNGSGDWNVFEIFGYSNSTITGSTFTGDTTMDESTVDIFGMSQTEPDCTFDNRAWPSGIVFSGNTISGGSPTYSALTLKRVINCDIYGNYIQADGFGYGSSSGIVRVRHGTDIVWYDNVLKNSSSNSAGYFYTIRGMTSEPQSGPCGAYDSHFYNNTLDTNSVSMNVVRHWNDSSDNYIQNNLVIGNINLAVKDSTSQYCDGCGEDTYPTGNLFRDNVITGTLTDTDDGSISGWTFSNNTDSAGTALQAPKNLTIVPSN